MTEAHRHARPPAGRVVLLALALAVAMSAPLRAQISPGPLARAHATLEGPTQCTTCHGNRKDAMSAQCAACHKDIGWLAQRERGYHGTPKVRATPCASCHPDHAGTDFALVQWPGGSPERFDHALAGWPLKQKHADVKCADCHTAKLAATPPSNLSVRKTGQGYTGLATPCTACHEDIHRGALGQDCTTCHDLAGWTTTPGFDHDTTAYALTDKHAEVKCDQCHLDTRLNPKPDGKGHLVPVYKPVPFASCQDCHADPHKGAMGPKCADCHTTQGFQVIDRNRFDHARTKYPLEGRHAAVACSACHKDFSTPALKKPAFAACTDCHRDAHAGTATLAGRPADCRACHGLAGFTPSTYTVAQHASTPYPLEGKHQAVRCSACHTRSTAANAVSRFGSSRVVLRPAFAKCTDCHADDHGGQLSARADQGQCSVCHQVTGWRPSRFGRAEHDTLRLALDGGHLEAPCTACHAATRPGLPPVRPATGTVGKAGFVFQVSEVDCAACHLDPHQGRFSTGGERAKATGCRACHGTAAFRPSTADVAVHASFDFPLEGAHRATPCAACHTDLTGTTTAAGRSTLVRAGTRFAPLTFTARRECVACHESPHGTQFAAWDAKGGCAACHSAEAFVPADRFNHDRDASFPLKGAHERVACGQCHVKDPAGPNPTVLLYTPLSTACESCHGKESR